jgi:hypothetical protein
MKIIAVLFLSFCFTHYALASDSTYDTVLAGKKCQEDKSQNLSCSYSVGKSLSIEILDIGLPDSSVRFNKSDFDGDFYGAYGMLHGCIIIKNKKEIFSLAFVSPRNGKIYRTWQECKSGV